MSSPAITVDGVWKSFRLYHERNQYLKSAVLRGRRARYEEFWALKDVGFEVAQGETFGIIGSNGSGKSTMLKCLAGIIYPEQGTLAANGRVAALLELGAGFHPELTGVENIFLNGAILGMSKADIEQRFDDIVEFADITNFIDTPVKNYSSGMVVRLGFAIAANVEPEILLVDEVLSVGDESFQRKCAEKIESFRAEGRTIVFVSHGLTQVDQLCERAAWLESGEVKMIGPSHEVVSVYTGASHTEREETDAPGPTNRWGSGEARMLDVQLLDEHRQPVTVLETGRPATIAIDFETHAHLPELTIGLRITHLHGLGLFGTNTRRRQQILRDVDGRGRAEFQFDELPLLQGVYDITLALSDHTESHAYDHWEKGVRFEVRQTGVYDEGVVAGKGTWDVKLDARQQT